MAPAFSPKAQISGNLQEISPVLLEWDKNRSTGWHGRCISHLRHHLTTGGVRRTVPRVADSHQTQNSPDGLGTPSNRPCPRSLQPDTFPRPAAPGASRPVSFCTRFASNHKGMGKAEAQESGRGRGQGKDRSRRPRCDPHCLSPCPCPCPCPMSFCLFFTSRFPGFSRTTGPVATAGMNAATVRRGGRICPERERWRHSVRSRLPIHDADEQFEGTQPFGMRSSLRTGEAFTGRSARSAKLEGAQRHPRRGDDVNTD